MKFNEVYLGEAGAETPEFQDGGGSPQGGGGGGGGGVGGGPLSLEQYICNAREALGVDSHYSRFVFVCLFDDLILMGFWGHMTSGSEKILIPTFDLINFKH